MRILRHPATWLVAALVVAAGLYLFQPWRLFTTVVVNEAAPVATATASAAAQPTTKVLSSGNFVTHEHATTGKAKVLQLPDGKRVLRIEDLATSDGPDLRVWLSDQPVTDQWHTFDDGRYVELGELKGNKGNANYAIPASADLAKLRSVTIWCRRFSVSFGAAALA
ncbi:DM13 domain-containing protein [Nonomuraea sp. NPDC050556]|uniref:DM13 domain-containing protein n=1 Tax=Nonomuraea sp. NPDC050556 TaxID=3364369 RepID=UPI0037A0BE3E